MRLQEARPTHPNVSRTGACAVLLAVAAAVSGFSGGMSRPAAASPAGEAAQARPSCSLAVERMRLASGRTRKTAEISLRCAYRVDALGIRSSIPIRKVRRAASLVGPVPGDRLTCRRGLWPRVLFRRPRGVERAYLGGCSGSAGYNTRARITIAVSRSLCRPRRLRVRVQTFGGIDCRGSVYPCPLIGYSSMLVKNVGGC